MPITTRFLRTLALLCALAAPLPVAAPAAAQAPTCAAAYHPFFTGNCSVPATVYQFTLKQMAMEIAGGGLQVIRSGSQTFDVAQAGAGAVVGAYGSAAVVPPNTYTAMVPTVGGIWTVEGEFRDLVSGTGKGNCVTTASGASTNLADKAPTPYDLAGFFTANPSYLPPGMQVVGGDIVITDSSGGFPLTVDPGESFQLALVFNTSTGVEFLYNNGVCTSAYAGPLGVTMSVSAN